MLDKRPVALLASTVTLLFAGAAPSSSAAKARSCGVKKLGGSTNARVYVEKGKVSCRLATSTLRHADIQKERKGWTCYRGNARTKGTVEGIGCQRKNERDVISAVFIIE